MSQDPIIVYTLVLDDGAFAQMATGPIPTTSAEETIAILREGPIMAALVDCRLAQLARVGADWEIFDITVLSLTQVQSTYPDVPIPKPGNLHEEPDFLRYPHRSPKYQA